MVKSNISHFFPELQTHSAGLFGVMVALAAILLLAGLIARIGSSGGDPVQMVRAVMTAGILGIVIHSLPEWINELQLIAYQLIDGIGADPSDSYLRFASLVGGASAQAESEVGFWDILWGERGGIGDAMVYAALFLISKLAQAIMFLFFIAQQTLVLFQIALAPAFTAMFLIRSLASTATGFFLRLVAVSLWPIGWAISSLMTHALIDVAAKDNGQVVDYFQGTGFVMILSLWILLSTIGAPLIIWKLLSGAATAGESLFGSVGAALSQGTVYAVSGGMTASMMGASTAASATAATAGGLGGAVGGALGGGGMLVPAAIGLGSAMLGGGQGDSGPIDYNRRAAELSNQSS
jgi:hypothetical protein